jgi:hypothetical protein
MILKRQNPNATIANRNPREAKGEASATIILLEIKADDHKKTKIRGNRRTI